MTKGSPLSGPVGQIVAAHLGDLRDLLNSHGITNARLFGSVARGDDREGSDVDILMTFQRARACSTSPTSSASLKRSWASKLISAQR